MTTKVVRKEHKIKNICISFQLGVASLRTYAENIGRLADEHDEHSRKIIFGGIEKVIDAANAGNSPISGSLDAYHLSSPGITSQGDDPEIIDPVDDQPIEIANSEEGQALAPNHRMIRNINPLFIKLQDDIRRHSPTNGTTLRKGVVISLISCFESLMADLLHWAYQLNYGLIATDDKQIKLSEVLACGSVDKIYNLLIEHEIDTFLRMSLSDKLKTISDRLKIDISPLETHRLKIGEIHARRNIIVHNQGRANRRYIEAAAGFNEIEEGASTDPTEQYIQDASDEVEAFGLKLAQQFWRKFSKDTRGDADTALNNALFTGLIDQRFGFVVLLEEYGLQLKPMGEEIRRMIIVNLCIAHKEKGNGKRVKELLNNLDWSACALKFRLAVAILSEENDDIVDDLLKKSFASEEVSASGLIRWPLYRWLRDSEDFQPRMSRLGIDLSKHSELNQ